MTKIIPVKAHTRTVKDIPDPFSASLPAVRKSIAKTREDIRRAMSPTEIPVIDAVPAEDDVQDRFMAGIRWLLRGLR